MRCSSLSFKYALRQCRVHEEQIKADKLANDLKNKDIISFWKTVSRTSKLNIPLPENVNSACGTSNVVKMWKQHYERLLNCVTTDVNKSYVLSKINKTRKMFLLTKTKRPKKVHCNIIYSRKRFLKRKTCSALC